MDNKKPKKYNDADTKKEGSPIETPFKWTDARNKKNLIKTEDISPDKKEVLSDEEALLKINE